MMSTKGIKDNGNDMVGTRGRMKLGMIKEVTGYLVILIAFCLLSLFIVVKSYYIGIDAIAIASVVLITWDISSRITKAYYLHKVMIRFMDRIESQTY